ncbi:LANO_0B00452g1_1 [Lachancea nothofagi CBS 11611]|uniref:LANO_0B00452g1_1 n=1 Tax=Lachancea nothofagi CBS 11611 TaxID=1266666 RepID=A0A1G4IUG0_9SACH|nr:LANO_0B00452g1_1 [Lachancea nothofagi CBS 11611]
MRIFCRGLPIRMHGVLLLSPHPARTWSTARLVPRTETQPSCSCRGQTEIKSKAHIEMTERDSCSLETPTCSTASARPVPNAAKTSKDLALSLNCILTLRKSFSQKDTCGETTVGNRVTTKLPSTRIHTGFSPHKVDLSAPTMRSLRIGSVSKNPLNRKPTKTFAPADSL